MASSSSSAMKIIGIVLVLAGLGLAYWGHRLSGSIAAQITHAFTGSEPDQVMRYYVGAAASFVVGIFLFLKK
ncbi:MAG: DUF3185 family protein [Gallionella sp.]